MATFKERFLIGQGFFSGYLSVFLASLALAGVLCFHFPEQLTTPEFREVYTGTFMKTLLVSTLIASMFFALISFVLSQSKQRAVFALVLCTTAVIIGGFSVEGRAVEKANWHLGLDWLLLDLLLMAVIFIPIEMVFPKRDEQPRFHEEWRTDLIYFVISHLFIQFFGVITQKPATLFFGWMKLDGLRHWVQQLPFLLELTLAFFLTDLFQYWAHRFFHSHPYLWRFHSIHHSTQAMDWLAGSRTHFVDIFVTRSMSFIPLYVFNFSEITFNTYIFIIAIHAVFIHANTRINFGFLKYIFTTPQYHHWHHCNDPKYYGKNFAVFFPFIDRMFGTYYLPDNLWPTGTGLEETYYPKGYAKQLVYPFQKSPFGDSSDIAEEQRSKR